MRYGGIPVMEGIGHRHGRYSTGNVVSGTGRASRGGGL